MASISVKMIAVENYRSFGERQVFQLPSVNYNKPIAIIGYNNTGKSNLLNAIKYGLYESVREESFTINDFHNVDWNNAPNFKLKFTADIGDQHLTLGSDFINEVIINVNNDAVSSVNDTCNCYSGATQYSKKWIIKQKAPIYYINFHNIKDEISTQKTSWGNLKSFLAKHIQRLVDLDQIMKDKKDDFQEKVKESTDKVLEDSQLQSFIGSIQKNYQQNLRSDNCVVDFGLPHYEDIFLKMLFKIGLNGNTENLIPIDHFGDGFISMFVMAVIQAIAETNTGDKCLFLFEEPESFLHENHQEYFYKMVLCGLAEKGHQVIYTTHSDRMIDAFDTKGIIRLDIDENNQTVKAYNNILEFVDPSTGTNVLEFEEPINIVRFNEYVKTVEPNLNRMLFSKKVILVEGPNEILVYKEIIRLKVLEAIIERDDILDKNKFAETYINFENISFICHHGKATALYIVGLCKHFNIDYYLINDWDFEAAEVTLEAVKQFQNVAELKLSHLYLNLDPTRRGMLTTNRNLIESSSPENIHFNIKRLEEVIGYNFNDKSSLKIWNLIQNSDFTITEALYPDSLHIFLEIGNLINPESQGITVDDELPF